MLFFKLIYNIALAKLVLVFLSTFTTLASLSHPSPRPHTGYGLVFYYTNNLLLCTRKLLYSYAITSFFADYHFLVSWKIVCRVAATCLVDNLKWTRLPTKNPSLDAYWRFGCSFRKVDSHDFCQLRKWTHSQTEIIGSVDIIATASFPVWESWWS